MATENPNILFLEIFRSENRLKMSLSLDKGLSRTISNYSLCSVSFDDIFRICREITSVLNRARHKSGAEPELANSLKKHGQFLWEQLLTRPIKRALKESGNNDLVLSLEEELVGIPWELIFDGNEFLGLKFNIGRLIRSQREEALPRYRAFSPKQRMLILADPTADLKSAYAEGLNIRKQFDKFRDKISIDFKSTNINTFYVKKSLREYDIVHFAGHCECDDSNPRETGWLLRDGRFTASDILSIGEDSFFPSLVFSNACQSAQVNKGLIQADYQEKTYSLASAFLFSGVRHYIGVIQRIEDSVSFVFAKAFYAHLLKGGTVGEAVRRGRLRLVKEFGINSCFWASYLLYGAPNFVLFHVEIKTKFSPAKSAVNFSQKHRKKIKAIFGGVFLLSGLILVAFLLPSLNPTPYYLLRKARSLFKAGNNQQAISLSIQAINKNPNLLDAHLLLADSYARNGNKEEALKRYFEYMLQSEKQGDFKRLAHSYIMAGWFYQLDGVYPKAKEFYLKAIDLSRRQKDKLHEALALRKLAVWHMDKDENGTALELLTKSSEINREKQFLPDYRYNLACDYFDLGLLFVNKDDYKAARGFYDKSLKIFGALNLKNEMSDYYFNLGEICVWEKQYQKALSYYLKGLKIDEAQANLPSISVDYSMIGELYMEMDNLSIAEEYFKKAFVLARRINCRMELAAASHNLGILYKKSNRKSLARDYLRQAQEIYRTVDTS
ncbi:MAG: CHAT domain-containing protein, partial [Candidatus Omnitrophota bacterium]